MFEDQVGLPLIHAGKVRELYADGPDRLLLVATDRISAFDYVLHPTVPDKGAILTQLSSWWFDRLGDLVPNHVLPEPVPEPVRGRAVWCERLEMIPVECVARGYLTGSGWSDYRRTQAVGDVALPPGLLDGSRLPEPIFTPTTKAPVGEHDESLGFEAVRDLIGAELAEQVRDLTLAIYRYAAGVAAERGLLLADTKFEFGRRADGTVVLADEVLTPDSSRFWAADGWRPGESQQPYDKQFLRNWLLGSGWDRTRGTTPPDLPDEIVAATRHRYLEAYERLTGSPFA